jgi:hypothetical protein
MLKKAASLRLSFGRQASGIAGRIPRIREGMLFEHSL